MGVNFFIAKEEHFFVDGNRQIKSSGILGTYGVYTEVGQEGFLPNLANFTSLEQLAGRASLINDLNFGLPNRVATISAPYLIDSNNGAIKVLSGVSKEELLEFYQKYLELLVRKRQS